MVEERGEEEKNKMGQRKKGEKEEWGGERGAAREGQKKNHSIHWVEINFLSPAIYIVLD